ncbi:MAG: GNAT family N-acetyltransferase [Leptolyngbya sp. Prado105]|nr:GNAT family N-acetyltransferase [Leptolyngbya sp. Prado105]
MDIVKLRSSEFDQASDQLAAAFSQDPLIGHFLCDDKAAVLKQMSLALLNFAQPYDCTYTTAGGSKGVAVWLPPETSQFNLSQLWRVVTSGLLTVPFYLRWDRILDFASFIGTEIRLHNKTTPEPHWYLSMLGVSPECQGQGIGGKLLQPVLQEADRAKMPCYLETSTTGAVRFYQRQGFEIVHQGTFAGCEYWAMKRNPR